MVSWVQFPPLLTLLSDTGAEPLQMIFLFCQLAPGEALPFGDVTGNLRVGGQNGDFLFSLLPVPISVAPATLFPSQQPLVSAA